MCYNSNSKIPAERNKPMTLIENRQFDEERALYHLTNACVTNCQFAGPADGESALKETRNLVIDNCYFALRYPLWHAENFEIKNTAMNEQTRAALWYCRNGQITDSRLGGIKALRECEDVVLQGCVVQSEEFGWKCRRVLAENTELQSEYLFFDSRDIRLHHIRMQGKYSFQYIEGLQISDSVLDTKDAFWHCKNAVIKNSVIKGEYLGWYSDGLTLINCTLEGTQPLCYCRNLKLIDCRMNGCDLSFEYSDVEATVIGHIASVKNPRSGTITADSVGEIISEAPVMPCIGRVVLTASAD